MSQNMPPNQPGNPGDNTGAPQEGNYGYANPYYGQQNAAQGPALDEQGPVLKSADVQKLNRKALLFLGGIVLLLIIGVIFILGSFGGDSDEKAAVPEEEIKIPEVPTNVPQAQDAIPVQQLPPLPPDPPQDNYAQEQPANQPAEPTGPRPLTLAERRIQDGQGTAGGPGDNTEAQYLQAMLAPTGGQQPQQAQEQKVPASAQPLYNPDTLLLRGTYIRCVMETRIVTDYPGFSSCIVTEPVYSVNGRRLLLPKGSKVSGRYGNENINGPRVAVIWDRITTPTGLDVNMASPGVDNLGGAGHPGDFNAHWGSRIASALMISLVADAFKYAAAENGPTSSTITNSGNVIQEPYESVTARSMERLANQAMEKSINRAPTVTINQGTLVNIYVAKDVDFSSVLR